MIAYISGKCVYQEDDAVVVDVHGIGYRVYCPYPHRIASGSETMLYTYHYVREDISVLYGFLTRQELEVFLRLITVKGVGPRTGLGILRKIPSDEFIRGIEEENVAFLKTLPGVGPKMASQIVLDLKGKFVSTNTAPATQSNAAHEAVFDALADLGFKKNEINGIKNALVDSKLTEIDALIKYALKLLAR